MSGLALALAACLCFGLLNFYGPLESRGVPLLTFVFVSQTIAAGALVIFVVVGGIAPPPPAGLALGVFCGLVNLVSMSAHYYASRTGPIGVISVITAVGVSIPVAAGLLAGERPGTLQVAGMLLGFSGAAMATLGADRFVSGAAPATEIEPPSVRNGGRWAPVAVFSSVSFGGFLVLFAKASEENLPWAMTTTRISMAAGTLVAGLFLAPRLLVPQGRVLVIGSVGLLMVAATGLYAAAATVGLLSIAAVLTAVSPVVTVMLAWSLLGERLDRFQQVGVAVAMVGLALVVA